MIKNNGELTDLHKDLVLFLWNKKESTIYALEKGVERHRTHISRKCTDLNHEGVLSYREDKDGTRHYSLNKDKVKISYSSDRYLGSLIYLLFSFLAVAVLGILISIEFIPGATLMGILIFLKYLYSIILESENKVVKIRNFAKS